MQPIITRCLEEFPFPEIPTRIPKPKRLWVQGQARAFELLNRIPDYGVGIVGTRRPTWVVHNHIKESLAPLLPDSLVVVSGFARGVDRIAHETALSLRLPTIAVLGAGLKVQYPLENQDLRQKILANGGLIVTQFEDHEVPHTHHFLIRNHLIAAWSKAIWVVQAPKQSGALNTAAHARNLDRTVYSTPCFPGDARFRGNQNLIDHHFALPFWGAHSLGSTWLEFASLDGNPTQKEDRRQTSWLQDGKTASIERLHDWIQRSSNPEEALLSLLDDQTEKEKPGLTRGEESLKYDEPSSHG